MVSYNEPLARHTSFRIGGPAFCWLEADNINDILEAISISEKSNRPFTVFGKGTNFLVQDRGFDGIIINLRGRDFEVIKRDDEEILKIGAGLDISKLIRYAFQCGLSGCEFLAGIPGSFGGAVFMNAGVRDLEKPDTFKEVKDMIIDIDVLDLKDKKKKTLNKKDVDFKYRSSDLDGNIILSSRIRLVKDDKKSIDERLNAFMKKREWIQRLGFPSAGSVFKNPEGNRSAGMLIDACGLKGKRLGRAEISKTHANVIVNLGGAMARDVMGLIDLARYSVKEKFGIGLELELRVV